MAKRQVRQFVMQEDGTRRALGPILREKNDLYLVGCAVTGSDEGTPDNPKFSLKLRFEKKIFPEVQ